MIIFWHVIAAFFCVLGVLDFILEIRKAFLPQVVEGLWLLALIDKKNEDNAEVILRKATEYSEELPVIVCCKEISAETEKICEKICNEEDFERIMPNEL